MANRRMLHSALWESERFGKLSNLAKLIYIATITFADDEGRLKTNAELIRAKVLPYDNQVTTKEILACLSELKQKNLLIFYQVLDKQYAYHPNWTKWQTIRKDRFKPSDCPIPKPLQPTDNQTTTNGCGSAAKPNLTKPNLTKLGSSDDEQPKEKRSNNRTYEICKLYYFAITGGKNLDNEISETIKSFMDRNGIAAAKLKTYTDQQIKRAMNYCNNESLKAKEQGRGWDWTLETVGKKIDRVLTLNQITHE